MNLSDIAAKGGFPVGLLFATSYPPDSELEVVLEITRGLADCANIYGTSVIGGDTKEGCDITITGIAVGKVKKTMLMRRKGAMPGDVLYTTGTVGRGGTAMVKLLNNTDTQIATRELLEIEPRITLARQIARTGCVTSAMDTSDGLASALYQLAEINDVGIQVEWEENNFPLYKDAVRVSRAFNIPLTDFIFYGGDYEVVFTVRGEVHQEFEKKCRRLHLPVTRIGTVTNKKGVVLLKDGRISSIPNSGYEHFSATHTLPVLKK